MLINVYGNGAYIITITSSIGLILLYTAKETVLQAREQ